MEVERVRTHGGELKQTPRLESASSPLVSSLLSYLVYCIVYIHSVRLLDNAMFAEKQEHKLDSKQKSEQTLTLPPLLSSLLFSPLYCIVNMHYVFVGN